MGLLNRLLALIRRREITPVKPASRPAIVVAKPTELHRPRYDRVGGLYQCRACHYVHDYFPYMCRGCGRLFMEEAREEDINEFWKRVPPHLRPDKKWWICECGRRFKTEGAYCGRCIKRTKKRPAFPLPNFEWRDDNTIRCGKCLRVFSWPRKIDQRTSCPKCNNHLLVTYYRKPFTETRPIIPDTFDPTMSTPGIRVQAEEATRKFKDRKAHRLDRYRKRVKVIEGRENKAEMEKW